jgi:hypothetical protein
MRETVLAVALAFIALFAGLTVHVIVQDGISPDVLIALLVLALLGFGIVGALRNPPDD